MTLADSPDPHILNLSSGEGHSRQYVNHKSYKNTTIQTKPLKFQRITTQNQSQSHSLQASGLLPLPLPPTQVVCSDTNKNV